MEWAAFGLAASAILLGLIVAPPLALLAIGEPFAMATGALGP
jgi:hypothetical protein